MAIYLSKKIINEFLNHAQVDYPQECCGFILGRLEKNKSLGVEYIQTKNIQEKNKERRFLIDPIEYIRVEDLAEEKELSIISIVHSHPDHPDKPSEFDRVHSWPGFSYIIISVINGISKSFRSWILDEDRMKFSDEKIVIKE
mgnify:FL=1|tara:strand:+ start:526 stop:951 length:426 start_codon:yes stop_codon:yes gene_type:complete